MPDQPTAIVPTQPEQSIVPASTPRPSVGLAPTNMQEAFQFAKAAAASKMFGVQSPEQALMIIALANELGVGPATALVKMHVINNKPAMSADMQVLLCKKRPDVCKYFYCVESDDIHATWETWRVGDPQPSRLTFTFKEAERAELTKNPMWKKFPAQMLKKRASAFLARDVYPDLLAGLHEDDEAHEIPSRFGSPPHIETRPLHATIDSIEDDPYMVAFRAAQSDGEISVIATKVATLALHPADPRRIAYHQAFKAARERVAQTVIVESTHPSESR